MLYFPAISFFFEVHMCFDNKILLSNQLVNKAKYGRTLKADEIAFKHDIERTTVCLQGFSPYKLISFAITIQ